MAIALRCLCNIFWIKVYGSNMGLRFFSHIVRQRSNTTTNIQYPFSRSNILNKKIVVTRVAVLGVYATIVVDSLLPLKRIEDSIQSEEKTKCFSR